MIKFKFYQKNHKGYFPKNKVKSRKENMKKNDRKEKDEIRVVSSDDDQKIKTVGEVLANESSRMIMKILAGNKEMTINEISREIELSIPLVSHHIKKMQDAGMVKISKVGTSVKGHKMNYYCATNQSILITPPERKMHSLFASLKKISRFAAIGMAGLVSWAIVKPEDSTQLQSDLPESSDGKIALRADEKGDGDQNEWSATYQDFGNEGAQTREMQKDSPNEAAMPTVSEPIAESEPQMESESSGMDQMASQLAESERANTGSASLDTSVYPAPYERAAVAADATDPIFLSIIIPIGVILAGIIIERVLARRARNKTNQIT